MLKVIRAIDGTRANLIVSLTRIATSIVRYEDLAAGSIKMIESLFLEYLDTAAANLGRLGSGSFYVLSRHGLNT